MNIEEQNAYPPVVLVHGIYMRGWVMSLMARRLRRQGFETHCFSYPSLRLTPARNAALLADYLRRFDAGGVHLVAHSLGGIVVAHLLDHGSSSGVRRVVLCGSPLRGSIIAKRLARVPIVRWALGRSIVDGLLDDHAERYARAAPTVEVGSIVGVRTFGIGSFLGGFAGPNDGTVAVAETDLPANRDRVELPVSHFSMLFSSAVTTQIGCFLRDGCFCPRRVK